MTDLRTGNPIDWAHKGVPPHVDCYAHEDGVVYLYDEAKNAHVGIQLVGMTPQQIDMAVRLAVERLDETPCNRQQRRAQDADMRHRQ